MRYDEDHESQDVEDRRGETGGGGFGGRGIRLPMNRFGLGGLLVVIVLSLVFKQDFLGLLGDGGGDAGSPAVATGTPAAGGAVAEGDAERTARHLASFVLDDAQLVWGAVFRSAGQEYEKARLVLFRQAVRSGCGNAESAMGPFYCPADKRVYIDLGFFEDLARRYGAPGDFAQAYVIAHEIGHHIQNLMGTERRVRGAQEADRSKANRLSVALELQADCFAGVWAHSTEQRRLLEQGDVEEGLRAASAVGDDRLQRQATGDVRPESFTHGTSEQRAGWFRRGLTSGDPRACDTFGTGG